VKKIAVFLLFNIFICQQLFSQDLHLPKGFVITKYAKIPSARELAKISPELVVVGTESGEVYALLDENKDFQVDKTFLLTDKLKVGAGVAFQSPHLYISDKNRIYRIPHLLQNLQNPKLELITSSLPSSSYHGKRYIKFSPDGELYISVGAPCNVCLKKNPHYGSITKLNLQTKKLEVFSWGVRNTVGFAWHPLTKELWFTDNGRDWLGDDSPPDELNRAPQKDLHFGFPYLHGKDTLDPSFGGQAKGKKFIAPAGELGAHNAALGMLFYTGEMFPKKYQNNIFIAEHGSWNRSTKSGYRVTLVTLKGNEVINYEPFLTGFEKDGEVFGRPVDLLILDDGSLLLSDDTFGIIYRISYSGN
jgi:glucose/arabinose dehydrogenase